MNTTKNRHSRSSSNSGNKRTFSRTKPGRGKFQGGRGRGRNSNRSGGHKGGRGGRKMATFDPSKFINTNPTEPNTETYIPKNTFDSFGIDPKLAHTIKILGMSTPTPIQDQIIPEILSDKDVIGLAETGTGKTAAFLIPLIEKTFINKRRQTLILAPTRELALQIESEFRKLSQGLQLYSVVCVGGVNIRPQIKALRQNNHFVIGTPGRVLDLIKRNNFKTEYVSTVILDEADRMLDMGFINDIRKILSNVPTDRETLLFSATMSKETDKLVNNFLRNPVTVSVKKKDVISSIEQDIVNHGHHDKFETLINLLKEPELRRVIIFGSMKHSVEKLARMLSKNNIIAESIHGNKSHSGRQKALAKFKSGNARVLVATDVAARGIHVDNVTHVINYDLPNTFEDYVHRIGRTGRATKHGKALTFVQTKRKF